MINKTALLQALNKEGKTLKDLAQACKISTRSMSRRVNGYVDFTTNEMDACKRFLHLSCQESTAIFFPGVLQYKG